MKRYSRKDRLRYWFDNLMSKGMISLIAVLLVVSAVFIVITGIIGALSGGSDGQTSSLIRNVWDSFNHTLDAGDLAGDSDSDNVVFIILMAIVTIFGLFITSMLIGIISNGISDKVESLRKGRSIVAEEGHTIILGFDQITLDIIGQLILANENQPHACIVVMDNRDKTNMEDAIHEAFGRTGHTRIVCRSGHIDSLNDIAICSPQTCHSIIVNAPDDYMTTKAVLACSKLISDAIAAGTMGEEDIGDKAEKADKADNTGNPDKASGPYGPRTLHGDAPFVCAVVHSRQSIAPMLIAGQEHAEVFYFETTIARIMAQTLHRPGISQLFNELLSFRGTEVYVEPVPQDLVGAPIEEANRRLDTCVVIGIVRGGETILNPGRGVSLKSSDQVILLAPDDIPPAPSLPVQADTHAFAPVRRIADKFPRTALILGCNELVRSVIREADAYASPGSRVIVAASAELIVAAGLPQKRELTNLAIDVHACDIFSSTTLARLMAERPENVLILSDSTLPDDEADARVLMLLLQLYDLKQGTNYQFSVTSQLRNAENRQLAQVTDVADFVISNNLTAMMMAQVSQGRSKRAVIEELLSSRGSEIYMKPLSRYVIPCTTCSFYTIRSSAARYGEVAIGYKHFNANGSFTICLNPAGSSTVTLDEKDHIIVIAEDAG